MSNRFTYTIAGFLLFLMLLMAFFSILDDSFTTDEPVHVTAGYSYLTQKDMRLNAEHPPLIKDLAAIPLLFLDLNFPRDHPAWTQEDNPFWWHQFNLGGEFLYKSGNNPDQILLWSRIPMILILILVGFFVFKWTKELYGSRAALITLFLFSFSPTFISHGRLITTDVGAAAGAFISTYYFIKFLKEPTKKNLIISGVTLGLAQLIKFSLFLLFPIFSLLILIWSMVKSSNFKSFLKFFGIYLLKFILICIIFLIVIFPVYQYHVLNYPPERQVRDAEFLLSNHPLQFLRKLIPRMAKIPILRAYAQYFLGLSMIFQRAIGGHTTFFLGEISAAGWPQYFPIVYIIKESLAFHILSAISLIYLSFLIKEPPWKNTFRRIFDWIRNHFTEFSMMIFILIYWASSITSNLNIGVRHLLPVFPFTFLLVSGLLNLWLKNPPYGIKYLIIGILILWQVISVIKIYPYFLTYFNEIAGGQDGGYRYTVDSNLDWGQDLKRLKKWIEENKIEKIYLDYFGGGNPEYYLKEKYASWWGTRNPKELPKGNYLAVSASLLQGGRAKPAPGFDQPYGYYLWLYQYEPPIAKIGYSIFVYYIR